MKQEIKYLVVVEYLDGTRKEFYCPESRCIGTMFGGGKVVACRQLSKTSLAQIY